MKAITALLVAPLVLAGIATALVPPNFQTLVAGLQAASCGQQPPTPVFLATKLPHAPVSIHSNADFTPENGVLAGSGTAWDPYVIAGWNFPVQVSDGLHIEGTTAHVAIRDNVFLGVFETVTLDHAGVEIVNARNVVVEHNLVSLTNAGVRVVGSDSILVYDNRMLLLQWAGIEVAGSTRTTVTRNTVFCSAEGVINAMLGGPNVISYNDIGGNRDGIVNMVADGTKINFNYIHDTEAAGVHANLGGSGVDIRFNYWDSPDGPSGDGPGTGDSVICDAPSVQCVFSPWLISVPPGVGATWGAFGLPDLPVP